MEAPGTTWDPGWVLTHEGYNVLIRMRWNPALHSAMVPGMRARVRSAVARHGSAGWLYQVGVVATLLCRGLVRQT
jgi:hypothetical protein